MRRLMILWALVPLLMLPVNAREQRSAALLIDSGPNGKYTSQLIEGLYDRGIRATFLLLGSQAGEHPDIVARLLQDGHEIGCRGFTGEDMAHMSRRSIAGELLEFQTLLPEGYPLRLFCPPGGISDGVRQVAQARKLAIVSWCADAATPEETIPDGALILLQDRTAASVEAALALADTLLEKDWDLLTVTQLAKKRNTRLNPGEVYTAFPPDAETRQ